MFEGN